MRFTLINHAGFTVQVLNEYVTIILNCIISLCFLVIILLIQKDNMLLKIIIEFHDNDRACLHKLVCRKIARCHSSLFLSYFPRLTRDCIDLSFSAGYKSTPLHIAHIYVVNVLSKLRVLRQDIYWRIQLLGSLQETILFLCVHVQNCVCHI